MWGLCLLFPFVLWCFYKNCFFVFTEILSLTYNCLIICNVSWTSLHDWTEGYSVSPLRIWKVFWNRNAAYFIQSFSIDWLSGYLQGSTKMELESSYCENNVWPWICILAFKAEFKLTSKLKRQMYGAFLCIKKDLKLAWGAQGRQGYLQAFCQHLSATL